MKPKGREFKVFIPDHVWKAQREFNRLNEVIYHNKSLIMNLRQEELMKHTKVYEVWAFYGEEPKNILTIPSGSPFTFAADEQEAVIKSGIYHQLSSWRNAVGLPLDPEFITVIANEVGQIKVNK